MILSIHATYLRASMKDIIKKYRTTIYNLLQYLLVITIILESNSIYSQIYGCHIVIRATFICISVASIISMLLLKKGNVKFPRRVLLYIIYIISCSIIMLINTANTNGQFMIVLLFMIYLPLILLLLFNITKPELKMLLQKFINIIIVLCIISLSFWLLSSVFNVLHPSGTINVLWAKPYSAIETFYYVHFNTQEVWWLTGSPQIRNTGIFTEGPMYALILIIALLFNNTLLFEKNKRHLLKTLILFITIMTTFSATGIICAVIILASNLKDYLPKLKQINKKALLIITLIAIIVIVPIGASLALKKLSTGSASHRNMDLRNGLTAFTHHPIIGHGVNHERPGEENSLIGYGYSNAIIPILTDGGIFLGIVYMIPCISLALHALKHRKINYLCIIIIYSILLFTTLFQYRLSMIFLLALMYRLSFDFDDSAIKKVCHHV